MLSARPVLAAALFALVAAAAAGSGDANAQQIYRIVGPDGRITFSDKAPLETNVKASAAPVVPLASGSRDLASLPFELRQAASRYPVTLYSAPGCSACASGRSMLVGRGIPFSERTVISNDDIEALKRLSGGGTLPLLTVGGQQLKGFGDSEWSQFLDAAGYPKTSQLPPGYTPAPAAPLVAAQEQQAPAPARQAEPARAEAPVPAAPPAENPAGIRF